LSIDGAALSETVLPMLQLGMTGKEVRQKQKHCMICAPGFKRICIVFCLSTSVIDQNRNIPK